MACGLALLASGQVFAAYYSRGDISDGDLTFGPSWNGPGQCAHPQLSGAISLVQADIVSMCSNHNIYLNTIVFSAGTLWFVTGATGTISGTVKFSSGNKVIGVRTASVFDLDISLMSINDTIYVQLGNVTFNTVSTGTGKKLQCPSGTDYVAGNPIGVGITCKVVSTSSTPPTSAPIDLHFSKQVESYSTEIELK